MTRRGVLMLTEARSGSNWLGSLATAAGFGNLGEWLSPGIMGKPLEDYTPEAWAELALDRATANGVFHLKLFPRYIYLLQAKFRYDVLRHCLERHETHLVLVQRRDRLRQAISLARGQQTMKWRSDFAAKGEEVYDFELICRCLFHIGRSYDFWNTLVGAMELSARTFVYEDMLADPSPYLDHMADLLGQPRPGPQKSAFTIQRDARTEEWRDRFRADARRNGVLDFATTRAATLPPVWKPAGG